MDYDEKRWNIVAFSPHCCLHQLKRKSLPLQLMKATVRAESYNISSFFIVIHELQRCLLTVSKCHSISLLIYFLSFYLSRFSFYINKQMFQTHWSPYQLEEFTANMPHTHIWKYLYCLLTWAIIFLFLFSGGILNFEYIYIYIYIYILNFEYIYIYIYI